MAALAGALAWVAWRPTQVAPPRAVSESIVATPTTAQAPRPPLRLLVVTDLSGVLEPCGCTSRPLGGLDRLASVLRHERDGAGASLLLFAGNTFYGPPPETGNADRPVQDAWKAETIARILGELGTTAAAPGPLDLAEGQTRLAELSLSARFPLLASGVLLADEASTAAQQHATGRTEALQSSTVVAAGGQRVAVLGLLEGNPGARAQSWERKVNALRGGGVDHVIAAVGGSPEFAARVAGVLRNVDILVHTGGGDSTSTVGSVALVRAGALGERVAIVDVWPDRVEAPRYREIGSDTPREPRIARELARHNRRVNEHNRTLYEDRAAPPLPKGAPTYVGSRPCAACHTAAYLWWKQTPHGRAYATLQGSEKEFNLECVGCHVTGYGKPGGATVSHVSPLEDVGCESCHGPGSAHVEDSRPGRRLIRREVSTSTCVECHTKDTSDLFDAMTYRNALVAPGHGLPSPRFQKSEGHFRYPEGDAHHAARTGRIGSQK